MCVENLDPEDLRHYALNFDIYTHFTSPIRRYADILVHRLLTMALNEGTSTREKLHGIDYADMAREVSDLCLSQRKAGMEGEMLMHCMLLKDNVMETDALIMDIDYNQLYL